MRPRKILLSLAASAGLLVAACHPAARETSAATTAAASPLVGTEWVLMELGGRTPPPGDAARPATLTLSAEHASGFAGCNGFSGGYTPAGATLRFGSLGMTRKACAAGMELEREYMAALEATRAYRLTAQGLELRGGAGVVARFAARMPGRR